MSWRNMLQKTRFTLSVVVLNTATLFLAAYIFKPSLLPIFPATTVASQQTTYEVQGLKEPLPRTVISGWPIRIEIIAPDNGMHIDLPVDTGYFDSNTKKWTLSNTRAYFAEPSMLPNNSHGTTLIYGHNEREIFGHLSSLKQGVGAYAIVHTDNGQRFRYDYQDAKNLQPQDVSVFTHDGTPTLLVQTCAGDWFELRRMYRFTFGGVELAP